MTMSSTIKYAYSEAIERCEMLSAFESRNAVDANGESLYEMVKIVAQDKDLLTAYLATSARLLEEMFSPVVTESAYVDRAVAEVMDAEGNVTAPEKIPGFTMVLDRDEERWSAGRRDFVRYLTESLSSYAMWQWLMDKLPERANVYGELWQQMSAATVNALHRLGAPRKKKRTETGTSDNVVKANVCTECDCGCGSDAVVEEDDTTPSEEQEETVTTPTGNA